MSKYLLVTMVAMLLVGGYLFFRINKTDNNRSRNCTPAFADGGGPYYLPNSPFRSNIAPGANEGEPLVVSGKVLKNNCTTAVSNAIIDIWQASEEGSYQDDWYRGRITTGSQGEYTFQTVIPKGYGEGTTYRPPHIHFKIFINNQEKITSQIFFPDVKGRDGFNDAYIMKLETKEENGKRLHHGTHNIILP